MGKLFDALPDSFMRKVLDGEDPESVESLLENMKKFMEVQDKDEKLRFKTRASSAFWNVYQSISQKISPNMEKAKRLFLRFGLLDLKLLSTEDQKLVLSQPFDAPDPEQTVYYIDEWMMEVAQGKVKPSMTDETPKRAAKSTTNDNSGVQAKYERIAGGADAERSNYQRLVERRRINEDSLISTVNMINNHPQDPILEFPDVYTDDQVQKLDDILNTVRDLKSIDKEMKLTKNSFSSKYEEKVELERQLQASGSGTPETYDVDSKTVENEVGAIRQMIKMCVGRQGNHFPILASAYLPRETQEYNFKTILMDNLKKVEGFDPSIFDRNYRQQVNRILPYMILMPGYGNYGICWEPYDKYNKATSKGRLAIPIFTRAPFLSISMAMGDFRWQNAKEMASYHWMEEGLTGRYYQYVTDNKLKGDIKTMFVEDYILWLTKESEGIQKLHKDARYIFWRFVPFPDDKKEELSKQGYYYDQLWKKEQSFRMSQGY